MKERLYAVWPLCYQADIVRHRPVLPPVLDYETAVQYANELPPKFGPRCKHCKRVHWLSYKKGIYEWAIVSIYKGKIEDFAKRTYEQTHEALVGEVRPFDNRGIICPRMNIMTLEDYYRLMEQDQGKGIGGRMIFPVS